MVEFPFMERGPTEIFQEIVGIMKNSQPSQGVDRSDEEIKATGFVLDLFQSSNTPQKAIISELIPELDESDKYQADNMSIIIDNPYETDETDNE